MFTNSKQTGLLDKGYKYQQAEEEWIELQDVRQPRKQLYLHQEANSNSHQYDSLQEDNNRAREQKTTKEKGIAQSEQPFNSKIITMNGDTFKQIDKNKEIKKTKKTKIPPMHVSCSYCTAVQSIQGTVDAFICGCCDKMNSCDPIYGIFICGTCHSKVCYSIGPSELIRCTKCSTVNRVPDRIQKPKYIPQKFVNESQNVLVEQQLLSQIYPQI